MVVQNSSKLLRAAGQLHVDTGIGECGAVGPTSWVVVHYVKFSPALLVAWLCTVYSGVAAAETATVKYRGTVPLDTFQCVAIDRSSLVNRVCYDAAQEYMVILLYYHYCEIGAADVYLLLSAESIGQYFNANIKRSGSDGPFDCRTHRVSVNQCRAAS